MLDTSCLDSISQMGYCVELINNDGTLLYSSDICEKIEGNNSNIVGKQLVEVYNYTKNNRSVLMRVLNTGKSLTNIPCHYKSRSNRDYYWIVDASPVYQDGRLVGVLGISKEYSKIKKNADRINQNKLRVTSFVRYPLSYQYSANYVFEDIIHQCLPMQEAIRDAKNISNSVSSVLLSGETGTGKELFAQSIHNSSPHASGPFVAINCSAIPDTLLESTLFGTTKGAYTGALERKGLIEEAVDGSLFLDEINSMNLEMQAKMLRFLETKTFRRVGSNYELTSNARIISATNISPLECLQSNKIRPDLFYRLAVTSIFIPPLRERGDDIPLLANYMTTHTNDVLNKGIQKISQEVMDLFETYQWPGNVREMDHIIEHAITIATDEETTLQKFHLPYYFSAQFKHRPVPKSVGYQMQNYRQARAKVLEDAETEFIKEFIPKFIQQCNGNITQAAKKLDISRQHLHRLINEYVLDSSD